MTEVRTAFEDAAMMAKLASKPSQLNERVHLVRGSSSYRTHYGKSSSGWNRT